MNEITVLCWVCGTPLLTTDADRLDWPLRGEMFSPLQPNFLLRPGLLNLDIFCISCGMFPFNYDPGLPGAIGKGLKIKGPDGKPLITTIKQILMTSPGQLAASSESKSHEDAAAAGGNDKPLSEWPCPECGAKKNFHRKNCSKHLGAENTKHAPADASVPGADARPASPDKNPKHIVCPGCDRLVVDRADSGHLPQCPVKVGYMPLTADENLKNHADSLFASVTVGPDMSDAPISQEEINDLEEDRQRDRMRNIPRAELRRTVSEARSRGMTPATEVLRPDELFVPKGG